MGDAWSGHPRQAPSIGGWSPGRRRRTMDAPTHRPLRHGGAPMPASLDDHPGVIETRIVHDVHRRATTLLTDAVGMPSAPIHLVAELRDFVVATLHHHHACED